MTDPFKKSIFVLTQDLRRWEAQQAPTISNILSGNVANLAEGTAQKEFIERDFAKKFDRRLEALKIEFNRRRLYEDAETVELIRQTRGFTTSMEPDITQLNIAACRF
jgi:hypothetical protein